jgi:hypothetical protein
MVELPHKTKQLFDHFLSHDVREEVSHILETECADNLPLIHSPDPKRLEMIRFAIIRTSQGDINRLIDFVSLANRDWRDILAAASLQKR